MSKPLIQVTSLRACYGKVTALQGIDIQVNAGEVVAILGANGAGKTTLLNCLSGVLPTAEGDIHYEGQSIKGMKPWQLSIRGISHVPEGREIFPSMTVKENLMVVDAFGNGPVFTVADVLEMFPRLQERIGQMAGNLSGGEQQMLAIGRGLMARPSLMLFDEPSLGLSPAISKLVLSSISQLKKKGVSCILVEQNMKGALAISDRAYVLRVGRIVKHGRANEIANIDEMRAAYLGG